MSDSGRQPAGLLFGDLLRDLRRGARLSQEDLAGRAGLSPRTIGNLERRPTHRPYPQSVRLLADALQLTGPARDAFLTASGHPPPTSRLHTPPQTPATTPIATHGLPRGTVSFTGRDQELAHLRTAAAASTAVTIQVICGMPGVGKTTLAVHAAHQLAPYFPAGQLFIPLHTHTPGHPPASPAATLASLLQARGLTPAQIPPSLHARTALWRHHLATHPVLLVFDDAASTSQIQPLLPGTPGSQVLVTSRRRLTALDDTHLISLDPPTPSHAATLFAQHAQRPGLSPHDPAIQQICQLCGHLPAALAILAHQLSHHPSWTPTTLATTLATIPSPLDLLHLENTSLAASIDQSYVTLTPEQQQFYRRLGTHPGQHIDTRTTAALHHCSPATAHHHLQGLFDHCLLTEPAPGHYLMHPLIHQHARRHNPANDG